MSWITQKAFWTDTAERTLSSAAQGVVAGAGLDALAIGPGVHNLDLGSMAASGGVGALLMAVLALAKCIIAAAHSKGNPSITEASVPAGNVVEKAEGPDVIAGEANELPTGTVVRELDPDPELPGL